MPGGCNAWWFCPGHTSTHFRAPYPVHPRAFGTSGASRCEQKTDGGRTEEPGKRDDAKEEKSDRPVAKEACKDAGETGETGPETASQNPAETPASEQKVDERTGKQGLLELLGAMKVDTTTKAKLKSLRKGTSGPDGALKQKKVVMESTSSMFQQATTSQR